MAVVKGVKEKVHLPLYDGIRVAPGEQLRGELNGGKLRFFVDVQDKTKLVTNLQSSSLLPHYNTFEARAMRVVISDLPADFPDEAPGTPTDTGIFVLDDEDNLLDDKGATTTNEADAVKADISLGLRRLVELLKEARDSDDGFARLSIDDDAVELFGPAGAVDEDALLDAGGAVFLSEADLEFYIGELPDGEIPLREQVIPNNGSGNLIGKIIYNTVATFFVGEKVMIQMPTWFFPSGAGPYSETASLTTHGEPSPIATFRFAEPIFIDQQQNFRVEIEIPDPDMVPQLQRIYGPFFIWVVVDGYMTRDVQ